MALLDHNPLDHATSGRRGFTLVELLVVIFILMLLVGIMAPLVSNVIQYVTTQKSQAAINLLDVACRMYAADFSSAPLSGRTTTNDDFPPSNDANLYGCQMLVTLLTGYAKDLGTPDSSDPSKNTPDGKPNSFKTGNTPYPFADDDGNDGFGFRVCQGSKVYGPYNGAEKVRTSTVEAMTDITRSYNMKESTYNDLRYDIYSIRDKTGFPRPVFLDAFGQPILYYRYTAKDKYRMGTYDSKMLIKDGDNPHAIAELMTTYVDSNGAEHQDIVLHEDLCDVPPNDYIGTIGNGGVLTYYRADFMLLSWGGDKKWYTSGAIPAGSTLYSNKKDDANNLYAK